MAEYWISHVRKKNNAGRIILVQAMEYFSANNSLGAPQAMSPGKVVDMIVAGHTFYSCTKGQTGWKKGGLVDFYLATHANGQIKDNLDVLPTF